MAVELRVQEQDLKDRTRVRWEPADATAAPRVPSGPHLLLHVLLCALPAVVRGRVNGTVRLRPLLCQPVHGLGPEETSHSPGLFKLTRPFLASPLLILYLLDSMRVLHSSAFPDVHLGGVHTSRLEEEVTHFKIELEP